MSADPAILAHHAEAVDPTLVDWIRHRIDAVIGLEPVAIVVLLGALIILFPVVLMLIVWRNRRRLEQRRDDAG